MKDEKIAHLSLPSDAPAEENGPVLALERFLARQILAYLGNAPIALVLWNGQWFAKDGARTVGRVHIRDRGALWKLCINPDLYFGDL
jgi:hypothetical protein